MLPREAHDSNNHNDLPPSLGNSPPIVTHGVSAADPKLFEGRPEPENRNPANTVTAVGGVDREGALAGAEQFEQYHKPLESVQFGAVRKNNSSEFRVARRGFYPGFVEIRLFTHRGAGIYEPTKKKLSLTLKRLPELITLLERVVAESGSGK